MADELLGVGGAGHVKRLKDEGDGTVAEVVAVAGAGYTSTASFARPSDTNGYTAGDIEGPSTSSTAALEFDNIGPSAGGDIIITSASLEIDITSVPSGMTSYRLYLYNVTPPSALGDNAAWDLPSGDRASFTGQYIDLGTPVDLGSTLLVKTDGINAQVTVPTGGKLFGYLVTNGAYTPASATTRKITLHGTGL